MLQNLFAWLVTPISLLRCLPPVFSGTSTCCDMSIPPKLVNDLLALRHIVLGMSKLIGVKSEVSRTIVWSVISLYLLFRLFEDTISVELAQLSNLEKLVLGGNRLTGSICGVPVRPSLQCLFSLHLFEGSIPA